MDNTFKYGCVVSGDHFCERRKAERELRGFIKAGQNVFVQGERRMGKTSLVRKAVKRLEDNDLIYEINGEHRFGDSFFRQWILRSV